MTADSPTPRRKWRFLRWLIVLFVLLFAWAGWRAYAFHSALAKAKELGWTVYYVSPVEYIRQDWKAAFKKGTWLDGVKEVAIHEGSEYVQYIPILHRLNPRELFIWDASNFHDLSAFSPLTRLKSLGIGNTIKLTSVDTLKQLPSLRNVTLNECHALSDLEALKHIPALQSFALTGCTSLTNLDSLKHLPALAFVTLTNCTRLINLDALKHLPALEFVDLRGCKSLSIEYIAALRAARPNTIILTD